MNRRNFFFTIVILIAEALSMHESPAQVQQAALAYLTDSTTAGSKELSPGLDTSRNRFKGTIHENSMSSRGDTGSITTGMPTYSLKKCYEIALENNITLRQAQNNIKASRIDRKSARYSLLPAVSYDMGHYFTFGKNIDPVTNTFAFDNFSGGYTTLGLELELFSGFKKVNAIKQSTFLLNASEYDKKRLELELLTNITLTYARLLSDKEELNNKWKVIQNTYKELDIINEKIKAGRLSKYESYTFNARVNTEQADLITLQNDSIAALQDLKQLMNISYKDKFNIAFIDEKILAGIYAAKISEDELIESILSTHPAIRQAVSNKEAARVGVNIAQSNYFPTLSIGGNIVSNYNADQKDISGGKIPLTTQLNDNLGKNIDITLHIPIFSQMQNTNLVKKQKLNISNAQMDIENAKNSITTNVLHLINDFNAAREKYKVTLSAFEQNNLSYSLYQERYRLGQISSVELITAQDILNNATSKYIAAKLQLFFQFQLLELIKKYSAE